jgi:ribosomal protein S18 acetylase RimI-like enzyme
MTIVAADGFTIDELAALFNAGYEGYVVPFRVDADQLAGMIAAWNTDLSRSRVALRDGEPVGFAYLALRGDQAWIGGVGVVPAERRHGIGRRLMEAVLAEAPAGDVTLEVIEQNDAARLLYEDLGFEPVRMLEVWSLDVDVPAADVRDAPPSPVGEADLPWQRADESLRPGYERIEVDGGAAAIRHSGGLVSLLQLRADDLAAARALVAAARNRGTGLRFVNVPEGHLGTAAMAELGGKLDLRQYEMRLSRRSSEPRG